MQNRYTGDIADFGKFLLLKHLFPKENIATIWYLYPDETHNNDGSHTVDESNTKVFPHCHTLDSQMAEIFNTIYRGFIRHIDAFEILGVLPNGHFFRETILGQGAGYRKLWCDRAIDFIQRNSCRVVCLDPDNGIEPLGMKRLSIVKQGKYTTFEEIERFFDLESVEHVMIYQHFNRLKKHDQQMLEAKERFQTLYEAGRQLLSSATTQFSPVFTSSSQNLVMQFLNFYWILIRENLGEFLAKFNVYN